MVGDPGPMQKLIACRATLEQALEIIPTGSVNFVKRDTLLGTHDRCRPAAETTTTRSLEAAASTPLLASRAWRSVSR